MKKKLTKIWGIGMIVVLMASLLVIGVTPAGAASLAYSAQVIPGGNLTTNQISGGTDVALVRVAPNGDIFAVDPLNAAGVVGVPVYKSIDGGRTWGAAPTVVGALATDVIVDLRISPSYATDGTVVALVNTLAGNTVVYISNNAGVTYTVLGAMVVAGEAGTSLAISPVYNGAGEIMVGTSVAGAGFGDVYIWGQPATPYVWAAQGLGEDVTAVAFSSNYQSDFTVLAVGSTAANTFLHTRVTGNAWDANVGTLAPATITSITPLAIQAPGTGGGQDIVSATIVLPSDFRANVYPNQCIAYVAIRSQNVDDKVYRVLAGGGAVGASVPMDPNAPPGFAAAGDDEITSMAYSGTTLAGSLVVGYAATAAAQNAAVFRSDNPGSTLVTFAGAVKAPTGLSLVAGQLTYVALAADFATSNKIYAGTLGTNSALSVSVDGGVTFNQYGLVDTVMTTIDDFVAASTTELYLVTNNAAGTFASVWKSADAGATWSRVLSGVAAAANTAIIRLSPTYATDKTVLFGNGTAAASNVQISTDGGNLWIPLNSPIAPNDIAVKDQFTFYVGGPISVTVTNNGGWTWQLPGPTLVAGGVNDIDLDVATGHLLVGTNAGTVLMSTNNNVLYRGQGAAFAGGAAPIVVAFDSGYATNNIIYAVDATAGGAVVGVQRYDVTSAPGTLWTAIGASTQPADIISAPDGTLYVSDTAANGGMQRSLNPTSFPVAPAFEAVAGGAGGDGLPLGSTLTTLSRVDGSNIIYAINTAAPNILTYTDILTKAVPAIVTPAEGDIVLAARATVTIEPIAGNVGGTYSVQWNTRSDWLGVGNVLAIPVINTINLNTIAIPLPAGATIYLRVRATGTVFGPWSDTISFETQLTAGAINAPAILSPSENGTGPGGWDAELNPTFSWGVIGGATNYEFQLATDAGMTDLLVDLTGTDALGNVLVYNLTSMTLDYNSTYYWRVRAISATSETEWSAVVGFTTMAEPEEAPPPVTVEPQPTPIVTVEIPPATTTEVVVQEGDQVAQGYIWAIIIIGAVLVIAVIVLIVRTRRSV